MGPLIGSALYEGFGFHQPFFLLGTLLIFSSMLSTFAIRTPAENGWFYLQCINQSIIHFTDFRTNFNNR
jgi:hypothetical protein